MARDLILSLAAFEYDDSPAVGAHSLLKSLVAAVDVTTETTLFAIRSRTGLEPRSRCV